MVLNPYHCVATTFHVECTVPQLVVVRCCEQIWLVATGNAGRGRVDFPFHPCDVYMCTRICMCNNKYRRKTLWRWSHSSMPSSNNWITVTVDILVCILYFNEPLTALEDSLNYRLFRNNTFSNHYWYVYEVSHHTTDLHRGATFSVTFPVFTAINELVSLNF